MIRSDVDHRQDILIKRPQSGRRQPIEPLSSTDLRDSPGYLLACQAIKGVSVSERCCGLYFKMSSEFDVKCAVATLDGMIEALCSRYRSRIPSGVRKRYCSLVDKANAYTMALDDFTSPVEEGS